MTDRVDRPTPWSALGRIVVCDGAMGTMLHAAGAELEHSLSALNRSRPQLVRDVHAAYLAAGADLLQTNTFDASRPRLARAGFGDRVAEINSAGARLAREAIAADEEIRRGDRAAYVLGSVGPATGPHRASVLGEQIAALAEWVDAIVLETFGEIESLVQAVEVASAECDLPIIAQITFGDDGRTLRGEDPAEVAAALGALDVAAFGANCTVGPAVLQDVVAALAAGARLPVSVQPNAGTPRRRGRRLHYADNIDYFAAAAVGLVGGGASIVGGCCGTTPAHIRAVADAVAGLEPVHRQPAPDRPRSRPVEVGRSDPPRPVPVGWPEPDRPVVVAGLRAPHGPDVAAFVERARELTAAGATMLAIIDPEPGATRVSPIGAAVLLGERLGATVILQVETADRSLAALQADLLGAHAFGLYMVVCRTGSPRVAGDYPDGLASDVDSIGLVTALAGLNDGVDWRGVPVPARTRFVIGASLCTAATDRPRELDRAVAKVRAGVHFLLTDVIYDVGQAHDVLLEARARGITVPVLAAVAPFRDARTIARLTHEIPEVLVPDVVRAGEKHPDDGSAASSAVGIEIAEKLADQVCGVLVHSPRDPATSVGRVVADLSRAFRTQ